MPAFTPEAVAAMRAAGATEADIGQYQQQLPDNQVQLWRITGEADGYLLTRVEILADGTEELVLVEGAGTNARPVIAWALELAKKAGIPQLRTHITRTGLQRIYEAQGWHLAERVMRIKTNGR